MKNLIDSIQEAVVKLENGSLNQLELEALTVDARELYERLVVLRYKAYEQRIHNGIESAENVKVSGNELAEVDLVTDEHHTAPVAPAGGFDFEIFQDESVEVKTEEKASLLQTEPAPVQQPIVGVAPEVAPIELAVETHDTFEVEANPSDSPSVEDIAIESSDDTVVEPVFAENPFDLVEPVAEQATQAVNDNDDLFENVETVQAQVETPTSNVFFQETVTTVVSVQETTSVVSGEPHALSNRITKSIQSVRSNYTIVPLDTLKGSFSLNEKLHYINDLFGGVSEDFTNAINKLDAIGNMTNATQYLAELAEKQGWDFENETTEEFIAKVCRRHAASLA